MAAGSTYTPIATTTLSGVSTYTFSSIASTYTDLVLIASGTASNDNDWNIRVNGDTGSNYSSTILTGNGTAASSLRTSSQAQAIADWNGFAGTSGVAVGVFNFMNYANTSTYKTWLVRSNNAAYGTDAVVSLWRSTAAINSITLFRATGTFNSGTTLTLYGIAAA